MTSNSSATSTPAAEAGNFVQNFISGNIIKFLDDEFSKFEQQAKNCDRYTILDLRLPVRIIELFLKLFQLCVDNPILRQNIDSVELFAKIFLLMRTHFKAQCPCGLDVDWEAENASDDDDDDDGVDDDDWGGCSESDPLKRFLHFISQQEAKASIALKDASNKKLVKNLKHVQDWFLEQDGILVCEICNFKCKKYNDVVAHSKQPSHDRNLDIFKENESFAAFPDAKIETYGCKACKSEYSTYNSLVKHFDKTQHRDVVKKLPVGVTVSKSDNNRAKSDSKPAAKASKSDNDRAKNDTKTTGAANVKPASIQFQTKTSDSAEGRKATVTINYKTKKVSNVTTDTTQSSNNVKSQTNNVTKVEIKPGTQTKATNTVTAKPVNVSNTTATVDSKRPVDTSKSKAKPSKTDESKTTSTTTSINKTPAAIKTPTKKPEYSLKFIVSNGSSGKYCQICDWELADEEAIVSHAKGTDGSEHLETVSTFESNQEYIKTSINCDDFICILCGQHNPDIYELSCHFESDKHQAMVDSTKSPPAPAPKPAAKTTQPAAKVDKKSAAKTTPQPASKVDQKPVTKSTPQPAAKSDQKPIAKVTPQPVQQPAAKVSPQPSSKAAKKPAAKFNLNSLKLNDSDKKFLLQTSNKIQCMVCDVILNATGDVTEHINDQQHSQNISDFTQHEEYIELPNVKASTFNCLKCNSVFNSFVDILTHCKEHIEPPKVNLLESIKLKKSDEKFISKGKTEKSVKCNLCDKELPTESAVISHTGSSNHLKNYNMFIKNETYCVANKTSCSLCEHNCNDLAALVKHFKTDTHQKTAVKGKKPQTQAPIHIPSYAKPKLDQIVDIPAVIDSPKSAAPKKSKKIEETSVRKSRLQLFSMGDVNLEELMSYEQFPMKKPDNSYVIAKNDIFYCRICNVDLPAVTVAAHMNGASHRINAEVFESLQCYVLSTPESECVQCTMCELTFDHVHQLVKHFREKLHGKPVNVEKPKPPVPVPVENHVDTSQNTPTEVEVPLADDSDPTPTTDVVENKVDEEKEKSSPTLKPVRIPISDRKHIFRLGGTLVQCNLCNTKLADNEALVAHVNNLNHIRNSTIYLENESLIKQLDSVGSSFECISCAFNGELNKVIKHCKKRQHLLAKGCNVEDISDDEILDDEDDVDPTISEFDFKCITMKNGIVRCKLCHNKLTGVKNLLEHMNSDNHKTSSAIYKLNEPFIEQFDELEFSYKCNICEVIFTRLDTMIRHFSEEGHVPMNGTNEPQSAMLSNDIGERFDVTMCDFECYLCSVTFNGFAALSKHCHSPQHEVFKNSIQSDQNEIPYNITIVDYQYHCNACNIRLLNKALMEKHQSKRIHKDSVTFYRGRNPNEDPRSSIIEIVGYEYLCNLCWFPMYSAAELAIHERSNTHKSGKNFDDVWRFNERHLIMCQSMYKVRCKLCEKTIGIEKLIKHCTSRDHRLKFIANYSEESSQDRFIVWKNASQYCTLCDCKLINEHNLVNHVNSAKHKLKLLQN